MLVYNLPRTEAIFERFGGIDGSAYFIGGFGMTALTANDIVLVPIRSRRRPAARRQSRLPEIHAAADLESVLTAASVDRLAHTRPLTDGAGFGAHRDSRAFGAVGLGLG